MVYVIMKLVYFTYFLGLLYLLGRSLSYSVFSGDTFKARCKFVFKSVLVSIVWPLSVLSRTGRTYIQHFIKLN